MIETSGMEPSVVWLRMIGAVAADCRECGRPIKKQEWYVEVIRGASDARPNATVCRPCWAKPGVEAKYAP